MGDDEIARLDRLAAGMRVHLNCTVLGSSKIRSMYWKGSDVFSHSTVHKQECMGQSPVGFPALGWAPGLRIIFEKGHGLFC